MSDDYEHVSGGSLKLKKGLKLKKDKKHKKNKHIIQERKDNEKNVEQALSRDPTPASSSSSSSKTPAEASSWMTETQKKFMKQQEKQKQKRILEKAEETHKDRVAKFNEKLENLSEFYDIPKISWTK